MISFDEAVSLVLAAAKPIEGERVGISEAFGRVLCDPVQAQVSAPPNDTSAMDGYAVRDADLETLPARLRVSGESLAGHGYDGALESGCCVRIFTGAPVPADTDRVVIQEMVSREAALAIVDGLALDRYYLWHAIRADLLKRIGRYQDAAAAYDAAIARTDNAAERAFLQRGRDTVRPQ